VARGQPIRPEHLPTTTARPDLIAPSNSIEIQGLLGLWARRAFREQAESGDATVYEQLLQLAEPPVLRALLEECGHNRAAAAQILGIHRATLRQKLLKYGID
jgi:DNA-binding NtrC family response regulator